MGGGAGDNPHASAGGKGAKKPQLEGAFFRGGSKVFRTVNFELFAKGNKVIAIGGSLMLLASLTVISNMKSGKSKAASRKQDF
mmetsp:Transcript_9984/g.25405  ORF Transcript_9984/g.25405 Transcript_9984/m.25405 type:complete len:83 (-) Transcript_9984:152-400(-)|eukprot:CAMPEP_0198242782 /NCGR_PEP_ID=MMETSP1446-20131203/20638_1 /TAXON_ID=1461542 ORGANISM="Unidentified sp, Strain CCMP2111" /NCGR_SAMPLE_ID=MMETSP1446 /ASSEMBLY_ACC=CAM_ASM_001112 /LENGTH=82 /DNA_ID=CAMNT_0043926379 /DNA_START=103 /DNA_END=351 /DNA_ORIENTATION=-